MSWIFQLNYWGIFIQVITLLVGLILQYVYQKKENIRMELQVLIAQESERKRISVDMHDELGASFSTIRLISELALKQNGVDTLKSSIQTIHQKSIQINQTLREIIWALQSENDSLEGLLYYLNDYGQSFFLELQIGFEFEFSSEINFYKINGGRRRHILLIIKELFQNIVKHAGTKKTQMKVTVESEKLHMVIHDFGKGMGNQIQFGNGIQNMKSRIQILKGEIHFSDDNFKGATTHLIIPL
jgi:signal transduction histidine kinase